MLTKLNNAYIHQGFPKIVTKYIYIIANKWEYNKYIKCDLVQYAYKINQDHTNFKIITRVLNNNHAKQITGMLN